MPARAQDICVSVNGTPVAFDRPPIASAGRVLVPLRGVFERLGATVVYDRGNINATLGDRTIALRIGSTEATVDGQPRSLDVPAQVVGARTLIPLRFVAAALGAGVVYDAATRTVNIRSIAIATPAAALTVVTPTPAPQATIVRPVHVWLGHIAPTEGTRVSSLFSFAGRTLPNAQVQVTARSWYATQGARIDGLPATQQTRADANGYFSVQIAAQGFGTVHVGLFVTVTSADGSATLQREFHYHT